MTTSKVTKKQQIIGLVVSDKMEKTVVIKVDLKKAWGKISDEELDKTKGEFKAISVLIAQKYGQSENGYSKKLSAIFQRFESDKIKMRPPEVRT